MRKTTLVLPKVDPSGQLKYRVGEIAGELYNLRSAIAQGQLVPKKFLEHTGLIDAHGKGISAYHPSRAHYLHVMSESALFLLVRLSREISEEDRVHMVSNTTLWRTRLDHPF